MGRMLLGNAGAALFAAVAGTLAGVLFSHAPFWELVQFGVCAFVGITVVGTLGEWRRSRRSRP